MKSFVNEFKEFISKGDVLDMAIGIVIGTAFKNIVDSVVADLINPLIGLLFNADFSDLVLRIGVANFRYGHVISQIIHFLMIALVLFMVLKAVNKFRRKEEVK